MTPVRITFRIDPKSITDLDTKAKGFVGRASMGFKSVVQKTTVEMTAEIRALAPRKTGFLQDEIDQIPVEKILTEWIAFVISRAPYSVYVEFGTSKMKAQPFMRPILEKYAPIFEARIRAVLSGTA